MNLLKKTVYNLITKVFNIFVGFLYQFLFIPIFIKYLGTELYGIYIIINKIQNYFSLIDLRPSAILRYKISILQGDKSFLERNKALTSCLIISILSLPFFILFGILISVLIEKFFKIDPKYIFDVKVTVLLLSIYLGLKSLFGIPDAIIRGSNLEYKIWYINTLNLVIYSLLVLFFLIKGYGLIGIIVAMIIVAIIEFFIKFFVQKKHLNNYKLVKIKWIDVKNFFNYSGLYLLASLFMQILNTFEIIFIGIVIGSKFITSYFLMRVFIIRISESIGSIIISLSPTLGDLISNKNLKKVIILKNGLYIILFFISVFLMEFFLIFNKKFLELWVGNEFYLNETINFFFSLSVVFIIFISLEEMFINLLFLFKKKVKILFFLILFFIILSILLFSLFGLTGLALSFVISKFLQFILYMRLSNKKLNFQILINKLVYFIIIFIAINIFIFFRLEVDVNSINSWLNFVKYTIFYMFLWIILIVFIFNKHLIKFFLFLRKVLK